MKDVAFRFPHGVGDAVHLALMVPLWTRRGYAITVACTPFYRPLIEAAGARWAADDGTPPTHPWMHPLTPSYLHAPWAGNKAGANLRCDPGPRVGLPAQLWDEYLAVKLPAPDGAPSVLNQLGLPRRYVVTHLKGDSGTLLKNLPDHACLTLWRDLLDAEGMGDVTVVNLDDGGVCPPCAHRRLRSISPRLLGMDLADVYHLLAGAALVVGIDSGVLHLARWAGAPALGLWTHNRPWHFALPRPDATHLAQPPGAADAPAAAPYNAAAWPGGGVTGGAAAGVALRLLGGKVHGPAAVPTTGPVAATA